MGGREARRRPLREVSGTAMITATIAFGSSGARWDEPPHEHRQHERERHPRTPHDQDFPFDFHQSFPRNIVLPSFGEDLPSQRQQSQA